MTVILAKEELSYIENKASDREFPSISLMMGIAVSNEEQNIGLLLENLLRNAPGEIETICIVSSGSTDKTNEIVKLYSNSDRRVKLMIEQERNGKASALNML